MIENNMNNLSLISQSIDSWNLYVNNDLNENNDNVFQEIINMTNIHDNLEYNNISDVIDVINNNKLENYEENNENINNDNDNINEENKNSVEEGEKEESESKNNNNSESGSKRNESQYSSENKEENI